MLIGQSSPIVEWNLKVTRTGSQSTSLAEYGPEEAAVAGEMMMCTDGATVGPMDHLEVALTPGHMDAESNPCNPTITPYSPPECHAR